MAAGDPFRMLQPAGGSQRPGTWCGLRFIPRAEKKTLCSSTSVGNATFSRFAFYRPRGTHSGRRSSWASRSCRHGDTTYGGDGRASRASAESRVADEFEAFVRVISAASRGWTTATPDDVFDFLCYLDTRGKGSKVMHETSLPGVVRVSDKACR